MDCIVMAGGVPQEDDLLYAYTQGHPKALIDVAGKPMVQWVIDALTAASVRRIFVVGLRPEHGITSPKIAGYLDDRGSLIGNILAGIDRVLVVSPDTKQVLVCSSDIPMLTGDMVEAYLAQCTDPAVDIHYAIVSRERMEQRFPTSQRSYIHLRADGKSIGGDFAGCDLHVIAPHIGHAYRDLWNDLLDSRKSALKQALRLGPGFFTKLMTRRLSLDEIVRRVRQKFGMHVHPIPVEHPEMGMDADKPFQLEICRQALTEQRTL